MKKIRVGAVNYLNTKPMLYGIKRHPVLNEMDLIEDYPAKIAEMLIRDELDIGLVPVAAIPGLREWHIVSDYCIGCDGPVSSVCLFSDRPMEEIRRVYLDYQSRTSVSLARILLREYWKKEVELLDAGNEDFREQIKGDTAGVVIGDRALEQRHRSRYIFDLGEAWKGHTGLPFVFAAWIANKPVAPEFQASFNEANRRGLDSIPGVVRENPYDYFDLSKYYTQYIRYELDERKAQGMALFLKKLEASIGVERPSYISRQ